MGKATIVSHIGEGLYNVTIHRDRADVDALIAMLQVQIAADQSKLPTAQATWNAAIATAAAANVSLAAAIAAKDEEQIRNASGALRDANANVIVAQNDYKQIEIQIAANQLKITTLQAQTPPVSTATTAWCADYNVALTGEVGTIEVGLVPGKTENEIILPGGVSGNNSVYMASQDGILVPVVNQTPEQAYYNYAMLPGQVRWKPRYMTGVVLAVDTGLSTVDVLLDAPTSTHQFIDVTPVDALYGVYVDYMNAGSFFFEVGDHVVVKLEVDSNLVATPTVIGFVHNPRRPFPFMEGNTHLFDGSVYTIGNADGPFTWSTESWPGDALIMGNRTKYETQPQFVVISSTARSETVRVDWPANAYEFTKYWDGSGWTDSIRGVVHTTSTNHYAGRVWCKFPASPTGISLPVDVPATCSQDYTGSGTWNEVSSGHLSESAARAVVEGVSGIDEWSSVTGSPTTHPGRTDWHGWSWGGADRPNSYREVAIQVRWHTDPPPGYDEYYVILYVNSYSYAAWPDDASSRWVMRDGAYVVE